jgi:hypothetical protein
VNCLAFERLLDEGAPDGLPAEALAHARECASCARSLARARSLERALERYHSDESGPELEPTLVRLTERVMARVERGDARGVRWLALPDALPWWVRAAAEPAVVLSVALCAVLLWRADALLASTRAWSAAGGVVAMPAWLGAMVEGSGLAAALRQLASALAPGADVHWAVSTAFALGIAPLFALLALAMWRAGERIARGAGAAIAG